MINIFFIKKVLVTLVLLVLSTTFTISSPTILKGGTIGDGLDLANMRIGEHNQSTRMVFDVNYGEGYGTKKANTPANITGNYIFKLSDDSLSIEATFSGFRSSSFKRVDINNSKVESMSMMFGEAYDDDSSLTYKIKLYKPSKIKAFTLSNPPRIILDIY